MNLRSCEIFAKSALTSLSSSSWMIRGGGTGAAGRAPDTLDRSIQSSSKFKKEVRVNPTVSPPSKKNVNGEDPFHFTFTSTTTCHRLTRLSPFPRDSTITWCPSCCSSGCTWPPLSLCWSPKSRMNIRGAQPSSRSFSVSRSSSSPGRRANPHTLFFTPGHVLVVLLLKSFHRVMTENPGYLV